MAIVDVTIKRQRVVRTACIPTTFYKHLQILSAVRQLRTLISTRNTFSQFLFELHDDLERKKQSCVAEKGCFPVYGSMTVEVMFQIRFT